MFPVDDVIMTYFIGWAHTPNDSCIIYGMYCGATMVFPGSSLDRSSVRDKQYSLSRTKWHKLGLWNNLLCIDQAWEVTTCTLNTINVQSHEIYHQTELSIWRLIVVWKQLKIHHTHVLVGQKCFHTILGPQKSCHGNNSVLQAVYLYLFNLIDAK